MVKTMLTIIDMVYRMGCCIRKPATTISSTTTTTTTTTTSAATTTSTTTSATATTTGNCHISVQHMCSCMFKHMFLMQVMQSAADKLIHQQKCDQTRKQSTSYQA